VMFGAVRCNQVYAARLTFLTTREGNRLSTGQAHAALAAALLRQLHVGHLPGALECGNRLRCRNTC
jgi:hypothetical protein